MSIIRGCADIHFSFGFIQCLINYIIVKYLFNRKYISTFLVGDSTFYRTISLSIDLGFVQIEQN